MPARTVYQVAVTFRTVPSRAVEGAIEELKRYPSYRGASLHAHDVDGFSILQIDSPLPIWEEIVALDMRTVGFQDVGQFDQHTTPAMWS